MIGFPGFNSGWVSSLRVLGGHQQAQQTSMERLATGKQINRAGDDPAGLVAAENFKVRQNEITGLLDGFERETARLGATEGGLSVLQDMVLELSGLVVEGANTGALSEAERDSIGEQAAGLVKAINHVAQTTMFDGDQVLIGYTADRLGSVVVDGESMNLGRIAEVMKADPGAAQRLVEMAEERISGGRAAIGSRMNAIGSEMDVLREEFASNAGVLSRIEDADYAKETSDMVRARILEQATIKAILVERENAERVLDLITPAVDGAKRP